MTNELGTASPVALSPAFVAALAAERAALNASFAARQHAGARLDGAAFLIHLAETVAPIVTAVERSYPERVRGVVQQLTDVSLDLFAASLLGAEPQTPLVRTLWRDVLPRLSQLVALDPRNLAGGLSNAAVQVAAHRGARADEWVARLAATLPRCASVPQAFDVGVVLAWQAGLTQFRAAALDALLRLPEPLAGSLLDSSRSSAPGEVAACVAALRGDRWRRCDAGLASTISSPKPIPVRCVAKVGAFRGCGGPFLRPPRVYVREQQLLVTDGGDFWHLQADAYGAHFQRLDASVSDETPRGGRPKRGVPGIDPTGNVRWDAEVHEFPFLADASSQAFHEATLAVTLPTSHYLFLLARSGATP